MFNLGISEVLIIGGIALLIFGPDKLPSAIRSLGKGLADMKRTVNDFKRAFNQEIEESVNANDLGKDTLKLREIKHELKTGFNDLRSRDIGGFIDRFDESDKSSPSLPSESKFSTIGATPNPSDAPTSAVTKNTDAP